MSADIHRRTVLAAGSALFLASCMREPIADGPPPPAPQGPSPVAPPGADGVWYQVVAGDTLAGISRRSGVAVAAIQTANRLSGTSMQPGQRLWLPGATAVAAVAILPEGGPEPYRLVPRSSWTDRRVGGNHVQLGAVSRITVHHTDEHGAMATLPDLEVIRRIETYHRSPKPHGRGWAAIGYHFLVGRDGTVYEGRPARFQGAHTSGNNENNLGVSVIGDYTHKQPTEQQARALAAFLDDCRARYKVGKSKVYGHRDLRPTACPGDGLYRWLNNYRRT
jgi:LysM repeat protein